MTMKTFLHSALFISVLASCGAAEVSGGEEAQETFDGALFSAAWSERNFTSINVRFPASQPITDNRLLEIATALTGCRAESVEEIARFGDMADIKIAAQCDRTAEPKGPAVEPLLIQVATFADPRNAERLLARLDSMSVEASAVSLRARGITYNRIYAGPVSTRQEAAELRSRMRALGFKDAFIVRRPTTGV